MSKTGYYFLIFIGAFMGAVLWRFYSAERVELPKGETTTEIVMIDDNSSQNGEIENTSMDGGDPSLQKQVEKEIMVTDGERHTIPLDEIRRGCPGKDCILSIDAPEFESTKSAESWLDDAAPGIVFSKGDTNRFYAYDILISHEIVNDTIDGQRVLISYCPLCLTAVVFDPIVEGERVEFGVSGLLWESNLIMYDRKTQDNFWSQVLGEVVLGPLAGTKLPLLPSDQVLFGNWKKKFPNGEVLSSKFLRGGGGNPYAETHFDVSNTALSFADPTDTRLPFDDHVFGILEGGKAKAYRVESVRDKGTVRDEFQGLTIELRHEKKLDVVRMFEILPEGGERRINPLSGFWFSWSEAHPGTELYK
ncbi:MAG: DUF3179 domain-containing (seleno)protein [bacterium]|nr:DUF3179 domain-containing (seleno)protein [bacterium]